MAELLTALNACNRSNAHGWRMFAGSFVRHEAAYAKPLLAELALSEMDFVGEMEGDPDGLRILQLGNPLASALQNLAEWLRCHFAGYEELELPEVSEYGHLRYATQIAIGAPWKPPQERRTRPLPMVAIEVAGAFGVAPAEVLVNMREIEAAFSGSDGLRRVNDAAKGLADQDRSELDAILRKFRQLVAAGDAEQVTFEHLRRATSAYGEAWRGASARVKDYRDALGHADHLVRCVLQAIQAVATGRVVDCLANERIRWNGSTGEVEVESRDPRLLTIGAGALLTLAPDPIEEGTNYICSTELVFFDGQTPVTISAHALRP